MERCQCSDTSGTGGDRRRGEPDDGCCSRLDGDHLHSEVQADARTFSALGDETRYETLRRLAVADGEVCACELVGERGVDQSTTSRALDVLRRAGLVERRKDAQWRYYATTLRAETLLTAVDTTRRD